MKLLTAGTQAESRRLVRLSRSPAAAAAVLFAVIVSLRFTIHPSDVSGLYLLFIVPTALISFAYGTAAGLGAATLAVALLFHRTQVEPAELGASAFAMRALAFYAVPLTVRLARQETRSTAVAAPVGEPGEAPEEDRSHDPEQLTPRELEVLGLVASGHTNAEIARKLVLSVRTIESHRANLRRKLDRPTPRELVLHAQRYGVLNTDEVVHGQM
jgi:DNA-binding CsgD family transcriptional regulator